MAGHILRTLSRMSLPKIALSIGTTVQHQTGAQSLCATPRYESDECFAEAANGLLAEYDTISEMRRALMRGLPVGDQESHSPDELWAKYIAALRAHAENWGAMADAARNTTAKFVLAVHAFELV